MDGIEGEVGVVDMEHVDKVILNLKWFEVIEL